MADRYTKAVLTIIAGSLAVLAVENARLIQPARAQSGEPMHVIVDSMSGTAFSLAEPIAVHVEQ